jgi:alpha-L-rhamnosidase
MRRSQRSLRLSAALLMSSIPSIAVANETSTAPLAEEFENPPVEARPRVWWHWLNGNITEDGITKDIEWMSRIGIGGLQNFDAALFTPQVVDERLVYMTPPWKKAFRHAVTEADRHGLELAIAASPGWSETGGPWVPAADGMKKLVWTETDVAGGKARSLTLPTPPSQSGPFQDLTVAHALAADSAIPSLYSDVAVLAYRLPDKAASIPAMRVYSDDGKDLDAKLLLDGSLISTVTIPHDPAAARSQLFIELPTPTKVQSLTLGVAGVSRSIVDQPDLKPRLEAENADGTWQAVVPVPLEGAAQTTVSFAPVTAKRFRIIFDGIKPLTTVDRIGSAPGALTDTYRPAKPPRTNVAIAELRFTDEPRVNLAEVKGGFGLVPDYHALGESGLPEAKAPRPEDVIDLTAAMKPDGSLTWKAPKGNWRVLRLGYSLTGTVNHPASPEATGLEVDKYDGEAVGRYMETYLGMYADAAGEGNIGNKGLRALLTDSIEAGASNWTPKLEAQFRKLRGYDMRPWMPILTGAIIGSRAKSDAFLYDYRRTLGDLLVSQHYQVVAKAAHARGMKVYGEALELGRPSLGDDMAMRQFTDVPMAAFWTYSDRGGRRPVFLADMKGASSVAHVYGKKYVAAESLTSGFAPWAFSPSQLKPFIDMEFAHGINRPIIHTSVHQPLEKKPGLSLLIFGQHFTRHETWAEMAKPWIDYISRSSYLLQRGHDVADLAYYYGEEAPLTGLYQKAPVADAPTGNAFDFLNQDALFNHVTVSNGTIRTSGGAQYKLLYLGGSSAHATVETLKKLRDLARAGATIAGNAPTSTPALADKRSEFDVLVKELWGGGDSTTVGLGRVITASSANEALAKAKVAPDFDFSGAGAEILFVHRATETEDIYYLTNRKDRIEKGEARFRVSGKRPEMWRADTGKSEPLSYRIEGDQMIVPLDFAPNDAFFVLFREAATVPSLMVASPVARPLAEIKGPWDISFEEGRGAPAQLRLPELSSFSENANLGVRYFSGTASYRQSVTVPKKQSGERIILDLGDVGDVAEILIGGRSAGIAWKAPYRIDITDFVKPGRNDLEIRVANLWVNRLIGDAQPGATKIGFTTLPTYKADAPLRKSGLIGPVRIEAVTASAKQ